MKLKATGTSFVILTFPLFVCGQVSIQHSGSLTDHKSYILDCTITPFSGTATWAKDEITLTTCDPSLCDTDIDGVYTFSTSSSGIRVEINPVSITVDGLWKCTSSSGDFDERNVTSTRSLETSTTFESSPIIESTSTSIFVESKAGISPTDVSQLNTLNMFSFSSVAENFLSSIVASDRKHTSASFETENFETIDSTNASFFMHTTSSVPNSLLSSMSLIQTLDSYKTSIQSSMIETITMSPLNVTIESEYKSTSSYFNAVSLFSETTIGLLTSDSSFSSTTEVFPTNTVTETISTDMVSKFTVNTGMTSTETVSTGITSTETVSTGMTSTETVSTGMTSIETVNTGMTSIETVSTDLTSTETVSTGMTSTETVSTGMTSTETVSTGMTSTETVSTGMTSIETVSTGMTSPETVSTDMTSTETVSTGMTSTETLSTGMTSTETVSAGMASTETVSTGMTSTETVSTGMTSTETVSTGMTSTVTVSMGMTSTETVSTGMTSTETVSTGVTSTETESTGMATTETVSTGITSTDKNTETVSSTYDDKFILLTSTEHTLLVRSSLNTLGSFTSGIEDSKLITELFDKTISRSSNILTTSSSSLDTFSSKYVTTTTTIQHGLSESSKDDIFISAVSGTIGAFILVVLIAMVIRRYLMNRNKYKDEKHDEISKQYGWSDDGGMNSYNKNYTSREYQFNSSIHLPLQSYESPYFPYANDYKKNWDDDT